METFRLKSMTDFVLQEQKGGQQVNSITSQLHYRLRCIKKYAEFLKQPLKLEMFVPCDENGNVLPEEHKFLSCTKGYEYGKAKEKVLFEGFVLEKDELINNGILFWVGKFEGNENIENYISSNLTLTPNAIKRIFG